MQFVGAHTQERQAWCSPTIKDLGVVNHKETIYVEREDNQCPQLPFSLQGCWSDPIYGLQFKDVVGWLEQDSL